MSDYKIARLTGEIKDVEIVQNENVILSNGTVLLSATIKRNRPTVPAVRVIPRKK